MTNAIEVRGLCKEYGDFRLDRVDLTVPCGAIVGLIGENGAGKSTTLRAILNLIRPDGGTVKVFGRAVSEAEPDFKEDIGVVLDEASFHDPLKAPQVGRILSGAYRNWDQRCFDGYLDKFGLPRDKKIKDFSKGMRMKLSIATALSTTPVSSSWMSPPRGWTRWCATSCWTSSWTSSRMRGAPFSSPAISPATWRRPRTM